MDLGTLLTGSQSGHPEAREELLSIIQVELHDIATRLMRNQPANHTLQPTALVNEAFLKLAGRTPHTIKDQAHFMCLAAKTMRSILVDCARSRASERRGGQARHQEFCETRIGVEDTGIELIELDEALLRLSSKDETSARVAELRCFGGLKHSEIGDELGLSTRTIERHWSFARAWLTREVS